MTVVFADVVGSTSLVEKLEPESARRVLDRFFETTRVVVERHGGTVEKYIGDAVMAVFGIPVLHEDDALRAVRAAAGMRNALARLNEDLARRYGVTIEMRVGAATGEVVAGDHSRRQSFATGDAVNVAARLEKTAKPGETLVDERTYRLVRRAVDASPLGSIALKGRTEAVVAYRVLSVDVGSPVRRAHSAFVGRARELDALSKTLEEVARERTTRLVTVVGAAGVGKSRLVAEFLSACPAETAVIRGRCLPYGEGITYWPLKEALAEAARLRGEESAEESRARIRALAGDAPDADLIAERVAETVGFAEAARGHAGSAWATRRLLEEIARNQPLVLVLDDIQWAEPTFLDLVEHVAGESRAPILILCLARSELLDLRRSWAASSLVVLEPLSDQESARLVGTLLGDLELDEAARLKIIAAAEGLPLFVEEMVAMLVEDGSLRRVDGHWIAADLDRVAAPPTIHALLAARLDQLDVPERALLQRAAVEGQVFHRDAVAFLSPEGERAEVGSWLSELVLKGLIEPAGGELGDDTAYCFHHLLLRDVVYESIHKEERASLHARFAARIDERAGERASELDEIAGYHLEQAYLYEAELHPGAVNAELAERAAQRLGGAGRRAHARGDSSAAVGLLTRAIQLLPLGHEGRAELEYRLEHASLEIAPGKVRILTFARCLFRVPPGHDWQVRQRHGRHVIRCSRCGKENSRAGDYLTERAARARSAVLAYKEQPSGGGEPGGGGGDA